MAYKLDKLKKVIEEDIPKFEIRYKSESKLQKFIGFLLFFNKDYMKRYTTTFYPYVYFPTREDEKTNLKSRFTTLAHEYVHLYDAKINKILFPLSYITPQIFGILSLVSLLSFFNLWFLLFLFFVLFFAPIPSPWRGYWELRGYSMNLFIEYHATGGISKWTKERVLEQFINSNYYYMWPFKEKVKKEIDKIEAEIVSGTFLNRPYSEPFKKVLNIIK